MTFDLAIAGWLLVASLGGFIAGVALAPSLFHAALRHKN